MLRPVLRAAALRPFAREGPAPAFAGGIADRSAPSAKSAADDWKAVKCAGSERPRIGAVSADRILKKNVTSPPLRHSAIPTIIRRCRTCALSDVNAYGCPDRGAGKCHIVEGGRCASGEISYWNNSKAHVAQLLGIAAADERGFTVSRPAPSPPGPRPAVPSSNPDIRRAMH